MPHGDESACIQRPPNFFVAPPLVVRLRLHGICGENDSETLGHGLEDAELEDTETHLSMLMLMSFLSVFSFYLYVCIMSC